MMRTRTAAAAVAAALAIAGCGGDETPKSKSGGGSNSAAGGAADPGDPTGGAGPAGQRLDLEADATGELKFDKESLSAKAGKVTITMANPSSVPHAVSIRGGGVDEDGETVGKDGESTVEAELKAGEYEFYCPVNGHDQAGMKGTLTVK